jgi:ABC-type polar amino acid transport system ATPase subunit
LASQIANRVIFLDQGAIRADDTLENLAKHHANDQVRAFFGEKDGQS